MLPKRWLLAALVFLFSEGAFSADEESSLCTGITSPPVVPEREADCVSFDWRHRLPPKPRNQSGAGWCYAMTAAEALTFHTGRAVSSVHVAQRFQERSREFSVRNRFGQGLVNPVTQNVLGSIYNWPDGRSFRPEAGGRPDDAVRAAGGTELCAEEDLPYRAIELDAGRSSNRLRTRELFEGLETMVRNPNRSSLQIRSDLDPSCTAFESQLQLMFPNHNLRDLRRLARSINPQRGVVRSAADQLCQNKIRIPPMTISSWRPGSTSLGQFISQKSASGPVIVDYNSKVLGCPGAGRDVGDHSSLVVSRRFNQTSKRCEVLVRNSWGPQCDPDYSSEYQCQEGHIWIPQKTLEQASQSAHSIEPTRPGLRGTLN